jgi:outer membrane lipoprotein-sorting protein
MSSSSQTRRGPGRLLVLVLGIAALGALLGAFLGLRASAAQAPPEELSNAELLARAAEEPPEFGATVTVEQDLLPAQLLSAATGSEGPTSPLSGPQSARVWYGGEEQLRAELLGENGDKVFVKNGGRVSIYDGAANTLRTGEAPANEEGGLPQRERPVDETVTPAEVNRALAELAETSDLVQDAPVSFEGRGAYSLSLTPKSANSTLVNRAEALVDSETYLPIRFLLFADGSEAPVLSWQATNLDVGPVADERFAFQTPPGAEVLPLERPEERKGGERPDGAGAPEQVATVEEAQGAVDFGVKQFENAPGGRELKDVYLTPSGGVALVYGSGWGTVVLSQDPGERTAVPEGADGGEMGAILPTVDLGGGVEARELSTPIGTALTWSDGGVSYTVAGSVPTEKLEQAARGLR